MSTPLSSFLYVPANTALTDTFSLERQVRPSGKGADHIGVLDIDAYAGLLPKVWAAVNAKQARFQFFPVETALPTGIGLIGKRVRALALRRGVLPVHPQWQYLDENLFIDDLIPFLKQVRLKTKVDLLAGVVAPMLAFEEIAKGRPKFRWNFYSYSKEHEVVASAYGFRGYAEAAGRPFEACLAMVIAAQAWAALFDKVDYHDDTIGCIYDFCQDRDDVVQGLKTMQISPQALSLFPEHDRDAVLLALTAIRDYPA